MENRAAAGETSLKVVNRPFDSSFSSSSNSEDGDDGLVDSISVDFTTQRLDHILQFLDRKLSRSSPSPSESLPRPLPEFEGRGGGAGIFRLPSRGAGPVHPGTPPCVELRPQPSRETQAGCFLRTLTSSSAQLWAGGERGVRVWDLSRDLYSTGNGEAEEADTAPYSTSAGVTSPSLCMAADEGAQSVWTGHRDGKIRCWKMSRPASDRAARTRLEETLSWQAHRGPVLSIALSIYGGISCFCLFFSINLLFGWELAGFRFFSKWHAPGSAETSF